MDFFIGRGPTLPARLPGVEALGVPGPSEDCRKFDVAVGRVPRLAFSLRLLGSFPTETSRLPRLIGVLAWAFAVWL